MSGLSIRVRSYSLTISDLDPNYSTLWWYPSKTFWKEFLLGKTTAGEKQSLYNYSIRNQVDFCYSRLIVFLRYCMNAHARLGVRCSHVWLVQNFHELAYKFWPKSSPTSLPFYGFVAPLCNKYLTLINQWTDLLNLPCASIYIPCFSMHSTKAPARLRECEGSPGLSLLA